MIKIHISLEGGKMWYFSWILGLGFACGFSVLNALWFELKNKKEDKLK